MMYIFQVHVFEQFFEYMLNIVQIHDELFQIDTKHFLQLHEHFFYIV